PYHLIPSHNSSPPTHPPPPPNAHRPSLPTRRSSDLVPRRREVLEAVEGGPYHVMRVGRAEALREDVAYAGALDILTKSLGSTNRSEEHTSELQSRENRVCRLLLEKKKEIACA